MEKLKAGEQKSFTFDIGDAEGVDVYLINTVKAEDITDKMLGEQILENGKLITKITPPLEKGRYILFVSAGNEHILNEIFVDNWEYIDHREMDFQNSSFSPIGAYLNTDFSYGKFRNAEIFGCSLLNCKFEGADLSGALIRGSQLQFANFNHANFQGAVLDDSRLYYADLRYTNLNHASVEAGLDCANLQGAYLVDANFRGASLTNVNLTESNLHGANFEDANFRLANLTKAFLVNTNLTNARLIGVKLKDADLLNANLHGADLMGADLSGANLRGAIVTNEQLEEVDSLNGATMPDGTKHK